MDAYTESAALRTRLHQSASHPEIGVEVSVANGFGEVFFVDRRFPGQIGDRSGRTQDLVVGSGGQAQ